MSIFTGSSFLTHKDLPQACQVWTISKVDKQWVGSNDTKICVQFAESLTKSLCCNKLDLHRFAFMYGEKCDGWLDKQVQVYRSKARLLQREVPCIRICGPEYLRPEAVCDQDGRVIHLKETADAPKTERLIEPSPPVLQRKQSPSELLA